MAKKGKGMVRGDTEWGNFLKGQGIKKKALKSPTDRIVREDITMKELRRRSEEK